MTSPQPPLVTDTAYRDPNVGRVATLSQENDDLRREAERLREDLARVRASNRAETVRAAVGGVLTLAVLAACVLGIGATARTPGTARFRGATGRCSGRRRSRARRR